MVPELGLYRAEDVPLFGVVGEQRVVKGGHVAGLAGLRVGLRLAPEIPTLLGAARVLRVLPGQLLEVTAVLQLLLYLVGEVLLVRGE